MRTVGSKIVHGKIPVCPEVIIVLRTLEMIEDEKEDRWNIARSNMKRTCSWPAKEKHQLKRQTQPENKLILILVYAVASYRCQEHQFLMEKEPMMWSHWVHALKDMGRCWNPTTIGSVKKKTAIAGEFWSLRYTLDQICSHLLLYK